MPQEWRDTRHLRQVYGTTRFQELRIRKTLPSPLYWFKPPGGRKILWNLQLVGHWLVNGNSPEHQRLVEQHLKESDQS